MGSSIQVCEGEPGPSRIMWARCILSGRGHLENSGEQFCLTPKQVVTLANQALLISARHQHAMLQVACQENSPHDADPL